MKGKIDEKVEEYKKPALLLCGIWFIFLALKDDSIFNLITDKSLESRVLVTAATVTAATIPAFFGIGMIKESLFVTREPIEDYKKLLQTKYFWIAAGIFSLIIALLAVLMGTDFSFITAIISFVVGSYLTYFGIQFSGIPTTIPPEEERISIGDIRKRTPTTPPRPIQPQIDITPYIITCNTNIQCYAGDGMIHAGEKAFKCPHCRVLYHPSCVKQHLKKPNNCPVCKKPLDSAPRATPRKTQTTQRPSPKIDISPYIVECTTDIPCPVCNEKIYRGEQAFKHSNCGAFYHPSCVKKHLATPRNCLICKKPLI